MASKDNGERLQGKVQNANDQGGPERGVSLSHSGNLVLKATLPDVQKQDHPVVQQHLYPTIRDEQGHGKVHCRHSRKGR